ncbi:MAG: type II secretion system F family protein [Bacteroidota bacterium]
MKSENLIRQVIETQTGAGQKREQESAGIIKRLFGSKIRDRDRAEFCLQLAVMLEARVSLHRALQVLAKQTKNPRMQKVIESLGKEIQKGNSFDQALEAHPDVFDNLFIVTAEVGQESGRLAEVLTHLAQYLEKMAALARKFRQALTYPALVVSVACFAVAFLLIFIVPAFADMFRSFQVELPVSTRIIMSVSSFLTSYGIYGIGVLVVGLFLLRGFIRSSAVRERLEAFSFKLPFVGDIIIKTHVARFCRTLGTLLRAQVSLVDALTVSQRIATNKGIKEEIKTILNHVRQGRAIVEPLVDSVFFPPMVVQMIAVGEETSELDTMLLKVADYYEKEIDGKVETLSTVIEPVIVLFLGIVVAGILISMYLPMFDLVNVIGGG